MATSLSAYQIRSTQKPITFSQSEIEAAKQLIQLSSCDSEEDHYSSNNSCSYSVVQGKSLPHTMADSGGDVSSVSPSATTIHSQDENFARTIKRYRCIQDLYSVTAPLPTLKSKKKIKKCYGQFFIAYDSNYRITEEDLDKINLDIFDNIRSVLEKILG
ncbi:hypothetical protein CR513_10815, partial [Mucuna pruriens]